MQTPNVPMERKTGLLSGGLSLASGLTAVTLFIMMVITFVDVLGRYVFSAPIFGATEIIQALLAAMIFCAMAIVSDRDAHITVDLLEVPLHRRFGRSRQIFIGLVSAIGLLVIGIELAPVGLDALAHGRRTIVLGLSMGWFAFPGAVMCIFAALVQLVRSVRPS